MNLILRFFFIPLSECQVFLQDRGVNSGALDAPVTGGRDLGSVLNVMSNSLAYFRWLSPGILLQASR